MLAEHINWHLASITDPVTGHALPSLQQLTTTSGFAKRLGQTLANPDFIQGEIYHDMAQGNHTFSMSLIFIVQYLVNGPGFIALDQTEFQASASQQILVEWTKNLVNISDIDTGKAFSFITFVASGVVLPSTDVATGQAANPGMVGQEIAVRSSGSDFPSGSLSQIVQDAVWKPAVGLMSSPRQAIDLAKSASSPAKAPSSLLQEDAHGKLDVAEYQTIAMANLA